MDNKNNDDKSWLHIMSTILTNKDQKNIEYWSGVLFAFTINKFEYWLMHTNSGIHRDIVS